MIEENAVLPVRIGRVKKRASTCSELQCGWHPNAGVRMARRVLATEAHMTVPLSILLVDDDTNVCRLYGMILRNHGHSVETATDGAEALEILRLRPDDFDLLITDHWMPHMDGVGLVRALNSTLYVGAMMVCSGALNKDLSALYQKLGVTEAFEKPICLVDLFKALGEVRVTRKRPAPALRRVAQPAKKRKSAPRTKRRREAERAV